jgi:hypothetical protein
LLNDLNISNILLIFFSIKMRKNIQILYFINYLWRLNHLNINELLSSKDFLYNNYLINKFIP